METICSYIFFKVHVFLLKNYTMEKCFSLCRNSSVITENCELLFWTFFSVYSSPWCKLQALVYLNVRMQSVVYFDTFSNYSSTPCITHDLGHTFYPCVREWNNMHSHSTAPVIDIQSWRNSFVSNDNAGHKNAHSQISRNEVQQSFMFVHRHFLLFTISIYQLTFHKGFWNLVHLRLVHLSIYFTL